MILRERNLPLHESHDAGSFAAVFKHPSSWFLCLMYVANTYGFYFLITWLPTYLADVRHFAKTELALFAGFPLMLSVLADIFGGLTTDWITKRFGTRFGRCSVGFTGYAIAAVTMVIAANSASARTAGLLIGISTASSMFTLAPSWASCIDIGEHRAGVLSAAMNTSGNIGGFQPDRARLSGALVFQLGNSALCVSGPLLCGGTLLARDSARPADIVPDGGRGMRHRARALKCGAPYADLNGMSSIGNLASTLLHAVLPINLFPNNTTASTTAANALTSVQQPDSGQLSSFAQLANTLQQLQQSNPAEYTQVTQKIAANLQSAAQTAQASGNTTSAAQLNQLSTDFQMPPLPANCQISRTWLRPSAITATAARRAVVQRSVNC